MGKLAVTDFYIYRWRYVIGYVVLGLLLVALLYTVGFVVPGGVSSHEMSSSVASSKISLHVLYGNEPTSIFHLPYHLLQRASFRLLGVSDLSIKLPSLLMAFASIALIFGVLRLWFQRNTAIISGVIIVTTGQFLLSAQSGTPEISYLFWNSLLLFCTSMLAQSKQMQPLWFLTATTAGALSLYSPLEAYVIFALAATCLIHPHARFIVLKQKAWVLLTGIIIFITLLVPLVLSLAGQPSLLFDLFGVPTNLDALSWVHARELLNQYAGIGPVQSGEVITPAFGIVIFLLALLGLYRLFTAKYTAKSYIITIWALFLIPIIIFQSSAVDFAIAPLILLVAFAVDHLIRSWYRLFPLNPYARVAGLFPLAILFGGLIISNVDRFAYGYHYDPGARAAFSRDVSLLKANVETSSVLLVSPNKKEFFGLYAVHQQNQKLTVVDSLDAAKGQKNLVASREFKKDIATVPDKVITTDTANSSDRFYFYKNGL